MLYRAGAQGGAGELGRKVAAVADTALACPDRTQYVPVRIPP